MELYEKMMENPEYTYSQTDLESLLPAEDKNKLVEYLRELMAQQLVKLLQETEGKLFYKAVPQNEANLIKQMSPDEAMVYGYVESAGREGIWTKTIRIRSGLHQHVVNRCLKSLETKRITKSIKSVKFPTRKYVMLYHLQPSIEVTGGPWFSDTELDSEFVNLILKVVWKYISRQTFGDADIEADQISQIPGGEKFPSLEDIHYFVTQAQLSTVELTQPDILSICDVLVNDGKIERVVNGYKATWESLMEDQNREATECVVLPLVGE